MRRTKNCLPSSTASDMSILSVFGLGIEVGLGHEIDEAEFAVQLAHVLQALAQLGGGEHVALGHPEQRPHQRFRRAEELHAGEGDLVQVVLAAFFHGDRDVGRACRACWS